MAKPKDSGSTAEVTYPRTGEYVVTVGGQPVFSSSDKSVCEMKKAQLVQDKLRAGEVLELPEHQVKVGQTHFEHKDDRAGTIEY